eukprot:scaffold343_cov245-Pinguiococcus_pyrenoidosus.AAC.39
MRLHLGLVALWSAAGPAAPWPATAPAGPRGARRLLHAVGEGAQTAKDLDLQSTKLGLFSDPGPYSMKLRTKVLFGLNALEVAMLEAGRMGQQMLVLTGWNPARADPLFWELEPRGVNVTVMQVPCEPSVDDAAHLAAEVAGLAAGPDVIVSYGSGSVHDMAKVVAAVIGTDEPEAAGEQVYAMVKAAKEGRPFELQTAPIPLFTVAGNAGVGSEVNSLAHLVDDSFEECDDVLRVALGSPDGYVPLPAPYAAIVEPRLLMSSPPVESMQGALASFWACVEGYLHGPGFFQEYLCLNGVKRSTRALCRWTAKELPGQFEDPFDPADSRRPFGGSKEREDAAFASIAAGITKESVSSRFVLHEICSHLSAVTGVPYAFALCRLAPWWIAQAAVSMERREGRLSLGLAQLQLLMETIYKELGDHGAFADDLEALLEAKAAMEKRHEETIRSHEEEEDEDDSSDPQGEIVSPEEAFDPAGGDDLVDMAGKKVRTVPNSIRFVPLSPIGKTD